jgi:HlyD family secretion protein
MTDQPGNLDAFLGVAATSPRARLLKWGAVAIAVVLLLLLLGRCVLGGASQTAYATTPVRRADLTVTVSATGNLQPTNEVTVGSEISGTMTQVFVDNNDRVVKGQELARLDKSKLNDALSQSLAQLASAEATVAQTEATAAQTLATLNRQREVARLSGGKVPSKVELETATADYSRAQANVRVAQAAVAQARAQVSSDRTNIAKASIRSPVTGVVLARSIEPGQTVAASFSTPTLFTIAEDLSRMKLEAKVDEADVGQVRKGQRATFTVDAFPNRRFPAWISRVDVGASTTGASGSASATSASSTSASSVISYTAVLTVENRDLILRPGMTATADIVTDERKDVLLVPNAALRFNPDNGTSNSSGGPASMLMMRRPRGQVEKASEIGRGSRRSLYVLEPDGKLKAIAVTVGSSNGNETEIIGAGLAAGMKVVTGKLAATGG